MRNRISRALLVTAWLGAAAMAQTQAQPGASQAVAGTRLTINLPDALERARFNSPQFQSANIGALVAREDRVQAKAALLPTLNYFNQYLYTEGNGSPTAVFIANNGVHEYMSQAQVHGDLYAPGKRADYQRAVAAEAMARARAEVAARGLVVTVIESYYGLVAAERKLQYAQQNLREAQQFFDITQKQEQAGEAAHSDVIKAQILLEQRQRDAQDAGLAAEKGRVGLAVLVFPDFQQDFDVVDDLQNNVSLPPFPEVQALAAKNNPDIRAAEAAVEQEKWEVSSARSGYLPSLSVDYFFGIDANQFAIDNPQGQRNLGSVVQGQLTIPVWNWGATRSKVRQAQLHLQQARLDLSVAQRQLLANLNSFFQEAQTAGAQVSSLSHSANLAAESLRLTLLRYTAGEVTVLEVVDAQSTLAQARNAYADGLLRYRMALSDLQTLTGSF